MRGAGSLRQAGWSSLGKTLEEGELEERIWQIGLIVGLAGLTREDRTVEATANGKGAWQARTAGGRNDRLRAEAELPHEAGNWTSVACPIPR